MRKPIFESSCPSSSQQAKVVLKQNLFFLSKQWFTACSPKDSVFHDLGFCLFRYAVFRKLSSRYLPYTGRFFVNEMGFGSYT